MRRVSLPNAFLAEAEDQLRQGHTVHIRIDGRSMLPFLKGSQDCIELVPFPVGEPVKGQCFFYHWKNEYMVHRYVGQTSDGRYRMAGDGNLKRIEIVNRKELTGLLRSVQHADGQVDDCLSDRWLQQGMRWYYLRPLRCVLYLLGRIPAKLKQLLGIGSKKQTS